VKISGFSFVKNGVKLYYPIVEAIKSILPICDEFVVAVGKGDEDDDTKARIAAINNPKIKIIDTEWDLKKYPRGMENAHQTDIAKEHCTGDWLFYLQADEVIHEKYLPIIENRCKELAANKDVEGLLFKYKHFWGDYNHYHGGHGWYPHEIRIVRNDKDIHSWESAQSFRRIENFDGISYRQQEDTYKLNVALVDAYVYHYGWVRPPHLMVNKKKALDTIHKGSKRVQEMYQNVADVFDYGPLDRLKIFEETHPEVMTEMISNMDWQDKLQLTGKPNPLREAHKHERIKYRLISLMEKWLYGGKQIGGFKNYKMVEIKL
jgi:glycosyltransferase involved in cell wall biosynthesis